MKLSMIKKLGNKIAHRILSELEATNETVCQSDMNGYESPDPAKITDRGVVQSVNLLFFR